MSRRERGAAAPAACLVILDGWGIAPPGPGNAISLARTPVMDGLWRRCPHAALSASGRDVGLPDGQMGNSEVGHLTLGAGAVVAQTLTRIDDAVASGALAENPVLRQALSDASRVHLIGMVSPGGVHSQLSHITAVLELAGQLRVPDLALHCITDGRDTDPHGAARYLAEVEDRLERTGTGRVASVTGRFYAMDRDQRWDRTQAAYDVIVHGRASHREETAAGAVAAAYERGESDEFIEPTAVGREGTVRPGDSVLCLNFRPDRMRQLVRALAEPALEDGVGMRGWSGRGGAPPVARLTTMTPYQEGWPYPAAFPPLHPRTTLAAEVAASGRSQLHVAETEKYAHVTYFFNGGVEEPLAGERRVLVPSRREVQTYDLAPEMSAEEVTRAFLEAFREERPALSVVNFANADMVGHSGSIPATITAVETVDRCLLELLDGVLGLGAACLITADHGNAESMLATDGGPQTAHTCNPVPLIADGIRGAVRPAGTLADVAPTILELLAIDVPDEMTGRSLLDGGPQARSALTAGRSRTAGAR